MHMNLTACKVMLRICKVDVVAFESDRDIPMVKTATQETEDLFLRKKRLHLIAAICFTVSWLCALMGVVNSSNDIQFALSCFMFALCACNAVAQFVLYFKKR